MRIGTMAASLYAALMTGTAGHAAVSAAVAADMAEAAPAAADGNPDDGAVATIVVTGQQTRATTVSATKTNTPLIETPQSITIIDNDELVRRNALSINQALTYVAGVGPNQRGNIATRYDQLTIRGFSPAIFLDGMRFQGGVYSTPQADFHRIESVDVIKGPASVLYGNSTPGGLVNLTSKLPTADPHGSIELAGGNYDLLRGVIDVGGPVNADGTLRVRVIGGGERSDGFIRLTENRRYHVSPMVSFVPDDATSLTLIASYQRDPKGGSYGSSPVFGSALPNVNGRVPVNFYDGEPTYEKFDRTQKSISALLRHDFTDGLRYRANMRYLEIDQQYRSVYNSRVLADQRTMVRGGGGSDEEYSTFTIDNSLAGAFDTGPLHHEVLVGLDFLHGQGTGFQRFATGAAAGIPNLDIFAPVYGVAIPDILAGAPATVVSRDQVGVYAQDQVRIGGLNLIGSIRRDRFDQRSRTGAVVSRIGQGRTTYRAGALYSLPFGLAPYASYSTSFEPQGGVNLAGEPYRPVTGRQYEAGVKFQPRGTESIVTVSAYNLARQNVLVSDPANVRNSIQVGEVKTKGIELEGRGALRPGLQYVFAGTYMTSRFTRGNPPSPTIVNGGVVSGTTGTRVLAIPKWTASSFLSYDLAQNAAISGALGGLNLGAGVRYVGGSDGLFTLVNGTTTTATRFRTNGYVLADALLGYDLGRLRPGLEGFSLAVNASNLLDTRHVSACIFDNWCYFGASRTVVGTLRYRW